MKTLFKVTTYYKNGLRSNTASFESKEAADRYIDYANRMGLRCELLPVHEFSYIGVEEVKR